jgi:CBS domain-containing protein
MRIAELMNPVETIEADATVRQAAERMRDLEIGSLPVCDGDRLVGIVTDRDIAVRSTAAGADPTNCRVEQVMTPHVDYCLADDNVQNAIDLMESKQIRRLPVLDCDHRLVGTVSLGDLAVMVDPKHSGQALRKVSEPG